MIYFIRPQGVDVVKIGESNNPIKRLRMLQTSHYKPLEIIKVIKNPDHLGEKLIHSVFRSYQTKSENEWYHFKDELVKFIDSIDEKHKYFIVDLEQLCSELNIPDKKLKAKINRNLHKSSKITFAEKVQRSQSLLIAQGFKESTLKSWMYGNRVPSFDNAVKLASILGLLLSEIPYRQIVINRP